VKTGVQVSRCRRCGWRGLPLRLRCPRCGGEEIAFVVARRGRLLETTTLERAPGGLERPVTLGAVQLENGGVVIARVERDAAPGGAVRLWTDGGAPVAGSGSS
jgi:uncharacterized OB-fold protein